MVTPILVSKLYLPQPGPGTIPRPRLIERLEEGRNRRLTLVSAPAGFGKTTVVSRWLASCGRPVAWLSLDAADRDPARFLAYLVAALRTAAPGLGDGILGSLTSPQAPPTEVILTALLNDIAALPNPIVLVLDDYHLVDSDVVDDALGYLLDHAPPQVHLVITTREDPRLPLARLRARNQMVELRAADLRFTDEETAAFLTNGTGIALTDADIEALGARTEGWAAGLQLAALSMRGREDVSGFIRDFAGDDRFVIDYLVEEVLRRQPEDVRQFLLHTSILDRLSGPLCDAVTGQQHSAARLEALERANVFVIPLDERRRWYRYHHLFGDVLRAHLIDADPHLPPELHRRASAWYARNDDLPAAIRHAFAAGDAAGAADLIERAMPAMRRARQEMTLLGWLRALPDEVFRVRPVLSVDYAGTLLQAIGDVEGVETRLRDAERWLDRAHPPPGEMIVWNEEEFHRLPGQIAIYRAGEALVRGDIEGTMRHANRARDLLPERDDFGQGAAAGLLGLASWTRGDLEAGHRLYTACMAHLERAGFIADMFGCAVVMADIRIAQGRLRDAMATFERALRLPEEHGVPALRGMADMHVGMSEVLRERNDLDAAIAHLARSDALGEHLGLPQHPYRRRVAMAHVRQAEGDVAGALALLDEAERVYVGDFLPEVRPIAAIRTRVWIAQGELGRATEWARERSLTPGDALSYLREFEHITLARLLLARSRRDGNAASSEHLTALLARLLAAAEAGGRTGSIIEILILQALALELRSDPDAALEPLARALALAEPEGYARVFIDEGEPMGRILTAARARGLEPGYTTRLLAALGTSTARGQRPASPAQSLADPLTDREIEVLRLVAEGRSNREIADRLYLALDTVKGHNRRIFAKLDVQRRTEAIARARELGLI